MKTKILALVLMALASGSAAVYAARPDNCPKQTCDRQAKCRLDSCTNPFRTAFEGLDLTADQQTKLQALRQEHRDKMAKDRSERKKDRKEQADKQVQSRRDYLAGVKAILTPEQYLQFLENSYVNTGRRFHMMHGKKDFKTKHMHHGKLNAPEARQ